MAPKDMMTLICASLQRAKAPAAVGPAAVAVADSALEEVVGRWNWGAEATAA